MTPQEELTEARSNLARYFEVCGFTPDDTISVVTRAAADGPLYWSTVTVAEAPRQIAARAKINCWISANPMHEAAERGSRGSTADVYAVRALWADLDVKEGGLPSMKAARQVIDEISELLGSQPVAVVFSGHGLQPRWRVDIGELHSPERMAPVLERFGELVKKLAADAGGAADSVYDLPRIIRAPHTTNIKPGLDPVPTRIRFFDGATTVTFEKLLDVLDSYAPARDTAKRDTQPVEDRHVSTERGDAYVQGALEYIKSDLRAIKNWPAGKTDERGRGWEKIQADAALRLASLAIADWNTLELDAAREFFVDNAPVDDTWTIRDVIKKWKSQEQRAEPADPPADNDSDDLLAGGGLPHRSAADEAAIWGEGDGHQSAEDIFGEITDETQPMDDMERQELDPLEPVSWERFAWDDFGNADRTIRRFGDRLRYSPGLKRWLRYDGGTWVESETGGERCVQEMLRELMTLEGPLYSDVPIQRSAKVFKSDRELFEEWVTQNRSAARVAAAAKVIRNSGDLDVAIQAYDAQPMLLNAPNGVVDLADGALLDHDPDLLLRRQIPVEYDPDAKAPKWEAFLERVQPSTDMRDYLQRIVGYTITGETREQVLFFHVGPPASGKSVYLEIMTAMLGELGRVIPSNTLLNKRVEQHPTEIMGMEGRRLLALDETPEGARLDESLVKRLSGESTLTARGMGENFRDFRMVGKVHLVTNHDPHISDDPAVHRRLHYVPWRNPVPVEERQQGLAQQIIREELAGVLAWAVRGSHRWLQDGLAKPAEAEMARSAYIASEDEFAMFVDEELVLVPHAFTPSKKVYLRYAQWCESLRMKPMSHVAFGRKLSARGVEATRTMHERGFRCFLKQGDRSPDLLA